MRAKNAPLVGLVAAVAVAAVALGATFAATRQADPVEQSGDAAPIGATQSPSPSDPPATTPPTVEPSATPSSKPTTPPATKRPSGPVKIKLSLAKLKRGGAPQVAYLQGRTVVGGGDSPITIPGKDPIIAVGRASSTILAILSTPSTTELLVVDSTGAVTDRAPGASTLATSEDARHAAYSTATTGKDGGPLPGGTVFFRDGDTGRTSRLARPKDSRLVVLAVIDKAVYFRSQVSEEASTWTLYRWRTGETSATKVSTVPSPTAVSLDASLAGSTVSISDSGTCNAAVEVATGKRRWRNCDYQLSSFSPDGRTALGAPGYRDGYADGLVSTLDAAGGKLLHEWSGVSIFESRFEDDEHILFTANDGEGTKGAIVRCTISSGACELATPLDRTPRSLSS